VVVIVRFVQVSRRSKLDLAGRMDGNIKVIFPGTESFNSGDYVIVKVQPAVPLTTESIWTSIFFCLQKAFSAGLLSLVSYNR
jgi:hypothetical protein